MFVTIWCRKEQGTSAQKASSQVATCRQQVFTYYATNTGHGTD